ncbi:MAG: hypothetical protein P8X63_01910 [Desulfuromonadaceae bacterium]
MLRAALGLSLSWLLLVAAAVGAMDFTSLDARMARGDVAAPLQRLQQWCDTNPASCAILWRMAQCYYEMARGAEDDAQKDKLLRQAEQLARQAVTVAPNNDEGYKWLAIVLGARAADCSIGDQVRLSREVRENVEKALVLEPDDDISLLVLSRWHYKVASLGIWSRALVRIVYGGLPDASLEQAEVLLLRAIAQHDRIAHRYALAKVYKRMGRDEAAQEQLQKALLLPVTFPEEAEDLEKAQAKLEYWS